MRIGLDARLVGSGLGIATYVTELARALGARPDVSVVWFGSARWAPPGAHVVRAAAWPFPLLDTRAGSWAARGARVDVLHFTAGTGWGRPGSAPSVLTVHDLIPFDRTPHRSARQRLGHAYVRRTMPAAIRTAAGVIAVSRTTADAVEARFARPCAVIPHGIRMPAAPPGAGERRQPYLVAFAGRDPRKAVDLAVEVRRRLGDAAGPLHLVARAGLPIGFADRTAAERSTGAVVVHPDLSRDALADLLAGATAVLYLSRSEGFGLPVLEAMAVGAPVVTGVAPATREVAGDAGLLVDPADVVGSAARHVRRLIDEPGLRTAIAKRARARAAAHDWETSAARHVDVYRSVLR